MENGLRECAICGAPTLQNRFRQQNQGVETLQVTRAYFSKQVANTRDDQDWDK